MLTRALVQVQQRDKPSIEARALLETFATRGVETHVFTHKRLTRRQLPLDRATFVAGHLDTMRQVFELLGMKGPFVSSYPASLREQLGRSVWESTLGAVLDRMEETGAPVFVKPLDHAKRFTGFVLRDRSDAYRLENSSRRLRVVCSDVVAFAHEHRAYVIDGEIVAIARYAGDGAAPHDFAMDCVAEMVRAGEAVRGFVIDVGVLSTGTPAVVECNDGFGLGLYQGVPFDRYTDLLTARWAECTEVDAATAHRGEASTKPTPS